MAVKTPTDAMGPAPSSTDKTNLITAFDAVITAVDAVLAGNTQAVTITVTGTPTAGTYVITLTDVKNGARSTTALAYNAAAATVQTALRLLAGDGVSTTTVSATGTTPNFVHTIQFKGTKESITVSVADSTTGGTHAFAVAQTVAFARALNPTGGDQFKEHFVDLIEVLATDMAV